LAVLLVAVLRVACFAALTQQVLMGQLTMKKSRQQGQ
jgi:uncharacterized membrane protein (DUF106 family)